MRSASWVVLVIAGSVSCKPASAPEASARTPVLVAAPSPTPVLVRPPSADGDATPRPDPDAPGGSVRAEPRKLTSEVLVAASAELFGKRPPRARELVVTEVTLVAELVRATPKSASDRPLLLRRLADSYFELALRPLEGNANERAARGALEEAAATLEQLLAEDAARRERPPAPQRSASAAALAPKDLAASLFRLGLAYELLGKTTEARNDFARVATADPDSPFAGPAAQRVTPQP